MKKFLNKIAKLGALIILGGTWILLAARPSWAPGAQDPLLVPGIAVHTFGVSPDADDANHPDGHATLRLYDTRDRSYAADRPTADFANKTYADTDWTYEKIGNVYGIAIDKRRNIYATASANWSPGYVGTGTTTGHDHVPVQYGSIGGGENNTSAGTVYKIDAKTGTPTVLAHLPQSTVDITNQVCQGTGADVTRQNVGAGLGNVAYDVFHDQLFVSNFSDGKIYRLDMSGNIRESLDLSGRGLTGLDNDGKTLKSSYGLAIGPDGTELYFGTMETNYRPQIFSIDLSADGNFSGNVKDQSIQLANDIFYTQNINGSISDTGVWAAYSDLEFTPDGELLVGVRVGCKGNFATSYNHGGVVYLLKKDSNGNWDASDKTDPDITNPGANMSTTYNSDPVGTNNQQNRAGFYNDGNNGTYKYDKGAIPLHPHELGRLDQGSLEYGPDDAYGGVAVWQTGSGDFDLYATSSDITTKEGVHGFMQFSSAFSITGHATLERAIGFPAVQSSTSHVTTNAQPYDYKGIGGDVEVLSVLPVSIGSYVWVDSDKQGDQDGSEPCIDEASVSLQYKGADGNFSAALDLNGKTVPAQRSNHGGVCGSYLFDNLPEGDYKVCTTLTPSATRIYTKSPVQNIADNDDTEGDSNIATTNGNTHCSGTFTLVANSEPAEADIEVGDNADSAHDTWGNMTVDFGFVRHVFDLALVKKLHTPGTTYHRGDNVVFDITVYNQGTEDATGVVVTDYLPEGMSFNDSDWSVSGTKATRTIGNLAAGASKTVQITLKVNDDCTQTSITNWAEIKSASNALGLDDADSTPDNQQCMPADIAHNDDTADTHGCDDIDPEPITVQLSDIDSDTDTNPTDTAPTDPDEHCVCDDVESNKADAMNMLALLMLMLGTWVVSVRFLPRGADVA